MNNPSIDRWGNKVWHNKEGYYHREDGPAIEYTNGDKVWFKNSKLHRTDGPAVQRINGYVQYWINDKEYDSIEEGLMNEALE